MARDTTRDDHCARVVRVVSEIDRRLDEDLDLEELAAIACFSPYHFHRVYRAVTGETPADTMRRLRLHRAAGALRRETTPLPRVARRAGYASVDAFSRAFAAAYGRTPKAYREGAAAHAARLAQEEIHAMYDVTIEPFAGVTLIGLAHQGDYHKIGATFDRLNALAGSRGLLTPETRAIAIYHDDPASVPEPKLRSFAGFSVPRGTVAPEGTERVEIPAGPVASLLHKGPYAELESAYKYLYGVWLPGSGRAPADRPCFEEYLNDPRSLPPTEWLTRVSMPLAA
jgi:AraC family transcriptional regulator